MAAGRPGMIVRGPCKGVVGGAVKLMEEGAPWTEAAVVLALKSASPAPCGIGITGWGGPVLLGRRDGEAAGGLSRRGILAAIASSAWKTSAPSDEETLRLFADEEGGRATCLAPRRMASAVVAPAAMPAEAPGPEPAMRKPPGDAPAMRAVPTPGTAIPL
mmetsp:Transcript_68378/g.139041  ORF Transcript_68378/g.139041 Transcript_68378/m.139041 type:complete len:160 (-) Transcript_68378:888-1367(-)